MRFLMIVFCACLSVRFIWDFSEMSKSKNAEVFTKRMLSAAFDAAMIILFAILEKGRW